MTRCDWDDGGRLGMTGMTSDDWVTRMTRMTRDD